MSIMTKKPALLASVLRNQQAITDGQATENEAAPEARFV